MNLNITGTMLDIILVVILVLSILRGWKNGLVDTVIRFVLTILVLGFSWFMSKPISTMITLPEMALETEILMFITPLLQRAVAFLGIFIVLIIAKNLIYMLFKPIVMKIIEFFKIVDFLDSLLGATFNVAKNVIIASLFLACFNLPVFVNGTQVLEESKGADIVMKISPSISDQLLAFGEGIVDFTEVETWATKDFSAKDMIFLLNTMNNFDVLTSEGLSSFYQEYTWQISILPEAVVSESEYSELMEMVNALPENEELKNVLSQKIIY